MIVPVFAPIRYPRMQSMFNPLSEQNIRNRNTMLKYMKLAKQFGYYGYNFNLAETVVPFSKISIYSKELPWLAEKGLLDATMETIGNWNTNGPHIYLSARYIYSGEEPSKIMDDYYEKLGGAAAPHIRAYWEGVDEAYRTADIHSGSFYGIEQIMTPQRLASAANASGRRRQSRQDRARERCRGFLPDRTRSGQTARSKRSTTSMPSVCRSAKLLTRSCALSTRSWKNRISFPSTPTPTAACSSANRSRAARRFWNRAAKLR